MSWKGSTKYYFYEIYTLGPHGKIKVLAFDYGERRKSRAADDGNNCEGYFPIFKCSFPTFFRLKCVDNLGFSSEFASLLKERFSGKSFSHC
jgi:hypothetical protein